MPAGRSVAVDNTNPTPEDRAPLLAAAWTRGAAAVAVWFPASFGLHERAEGETWQVGIRMRHAEPSR
jgi:predicted kinase